MIGQLPEGKSASAVTVVVVNWNGLEHLDACFASLEAQDWPKEALELLCVDNGSTDGSRGFLAERFPRVRVEALDTNTGFAAGCNTGARLASGDLLCFINNDMRADPAWVRRMVEPLIDDPRLGATGGKVLDWEGRTIDFAGAVMNWEGRGGQIGFGERTSSARHDRAGPILFANGGSLAIRRKLFRDVGGFDEDFFAYYEDVDLGWRLWLYGHPVRYVPEAVTYHRHRGTSGTLPSGKLRLLSERNAFLAAIKNYDEASLGRVLAPAFMLAIRRGFLDSGLDLDAFGLNRTERVEELVPHPETVATFGALEQVNRLLPKMLAKRAEVQRRRVRTDASLRRLFGDPFVVARPDGKYGRLQSELESLFGVEKIFATSRPKVLVVASDVVGSLMAGPGIRAVEICRVLSHEAEVTLASTRPTDLTGDSFEVVYAPPRKLSELASQAEVIVCPGLTLATYSFLASFRAPVVVDAYDPFSIALLEQGRDKPLDERERDDASVRASFELQLKLGDFFLCATDRQWAMLVGNLQLLGRIPPAVYDRDPTLRSLVALAPFGMSSTPPKPPDAPVLRGVIKGIGQNDLVLIWGGGIYNWLDPVSLIRAVGVAAMRHPEIKLVFLAGPHPNTGIPAMKAAHDARAAAERDGLLGRHVFFVERWIPYDERGAYLLEADVGVSTHRQHAESTLAFRTRFLDYLWAGLPVLCSSGDALGDLAAARSFGIAVPPEDVRGLSDALCSMAGDRGRLRRMSDAARETAEAYTWERTMAPLLEFVRNPLAALDRPRDGRNAIRTRPAYGTIRWKLSRLAQYRRDHGTKMAAGLIARRLLGRR
jgi:GT2 family glycosyltransferase/glycosyltransferase involved in cell wall biosynthesis